MVVRFRNGREGHPSDPGSTIVPQEDEEYAFCSVALRNVGAGVALITGIGLDFGEYGWSGDGSRMVVPPGEITRLTFAVPKNRPELSVGLDQIRGGYFVAKVSYTDALGRSILTTEAHCSKKPDGSFYVRQIFLGGGDGERFAGSGPADG
jgi:hypothetical protein